MSTRTTTPACPDGCCWGLVDADLGLPAWPTHVIRPMYQVIHPVWDGAAHAEPGPDAASWPDPAEGQGLEEDWCG